MLYRRMSALQTNIWTGIYALNKVLPLFVDLTQSQWIAAPMTKACVADLGEIALVRVGKDPPRLHVAHLGVVYQVGHRFQLQFGK